MTTSRQPNVNREHVPHSTYNGHSQRVHDSQQYFSFLPIIVQGFTEQAILFRVPIYHSNPYILQQVINQARWSASPYTFANHLTRYAVGTARIIEVSFREFKSPCATDRDCQIGRVRSTQAALGQKVLFEDFREDLFLTDAFQDLGSFLDIYGQRSTQGILLFASMSLADICEVAMPSLFGYPSTNSR